MEVVFEWAPNESEWAFWPMASVELWGKSDLSRPAKVGHAQAMLIELWETLNEVCAVEWAEDQDDITVAYVREPTRRLGVSIAWPAPRGPETDEELLKALDQALQKIDPRKATGEPWEVSSGIGLYCELEIEPL